MCRGVSRTNQGKGLVLVGLGSDIVVCMGAGYGLPGEGEGGTATLLHLLYLLHLLPMLHKHKNNKYLQQHKK